MEFQAPIASTNGQTAGFLHTTVGPALSPSQTVLYFGDLDFSGGHIEENTRKVLEKIVRSTLLGKIVRPTLAWERIAVTEDQVREFGLEPIPKYDARDKKMHSAVETEALGQSQIVSLLRARLEDLMPAKRRKRVLARESKERRKIGLQLGYIKRRRR